MLSSQCTRFCKVSAICIYIFCDPLIGVACEPVYPFWVPTLHTEGLQQSEVSSVQPASLRLRWVHVSAVSVCFRTPRLSLGHPGSFKSAHDLKCMRTQTAPLFNVPRGRREEQVTAWTRFELTTFWL